MAFSSKNSRKTSPEISDFTLNIVNNKKTEMYVKFAKVMVICQGPYTEQRKKFFESVQKLYKSASRILSDETYVSETKIPCSAEKTEDFYLYLREEVKAGLECGYNLIYIDTTMSSFSQNQYYFSLANKMQYVVIVLPPVITDSNDIYWPTKTQAESFLKLEPKVRIRTPNMFNHLFCAWFLHDIDSNELRNECVLYANDLFENVPEFCRWFSKVGPPEQFPRYFNLIPEDVKKEELVLREDLAFCPVKLFESEFKMSEYFQKPEVMKNYGKMSQLHIVGFIISPYMVAARVKLNFNQKQLWEMNDNLTESSNIELYPTELYQKSKAGLPSAEIKRICSKSNSTLTLGHSFEEPRNIITLTEKARTCHIVLGTSSEASRRNIDYDVAFAINRERQAIKENIECDILDIANCEVKKIGQYWYIYMKKTIMVNGIFSSCCMPTNFDLPVQTPK